jgi:hypothetical protein
MYNYHINIKLNNVQRSKGVQSVVTIKSQFPISQDAAVVFAENLYKSLADGNTVEKYDLNLLHCGKLIFSSFTMAQVAVAAHPYLTDEYSTKGGTTPESFSGNSLVTKNIRRHMGIAEDYDAEEVSKVPSSERFVLLGIL